MWSLPIWSMCSTVGCQTAVDFDITLLEAGYLRKFPNSAGYTGLELGARYWDFDLGLQPALAANIARSTDWIDGFVGFRSSKAMGQRWTRVLQGNIGAGGSDLTWVLQGTFSLEFRNGNSLAMGLKLLNLKYEDANVRGVNYQLDNLSFLGLTIGYEFD